MKRGENVNGERLRCVLRPFSLSPRKKKDWGEERKTKLAQNRSSMFLCLIDFTAREKEECVLPDEKEKIRTNPGRVIVEDYFFADRAAIADGCGRAVCRAITRVEIA